MSRRLLATSRTAGLRAVDDGRNTSTWGGTVSLDEKTGKLHSELHPSLSVACGAKLVRCTVSELRYHVSCSPPRISRCAQTAAVWASQMAGHCGINAWKINSLVVHAVAQKDQPTVFTRVSRSSTDMTFPIFTHEPSVSRAPSGEWVLYWSGYPEGHSLGPACLHACTDGSTPKNLSAFGCKLPRGGSPPTYMSWASSPDGPWTSPVEVLARPAHPASCLAPGVIF